MSQWLDADASRQGLGHRCALPLATLVSHYDTTRDRELSFRQLGQLRFQACSFLCDVIAGRATDLSHACQTVL